MTEQSKSDSKAKDRSDDAEINGATQSGDPRTTPGSAEGDEETVDESLRQKEGKQ
ncbi:MAG: hypothetical protein H0W76_06795 [Pyrinomonadaceae bacterium]|nr:hypothetical protein [Pyrinomonadaceae bacterium]